MNENIDSVKRLVCWYILCTVTFREGLNPIKHKISSHNGDQSYYQLSALMSGQEESLVNTHAYDIPKLYIMTQSADQLSDLSLNFNNQTFYQHN